jgi:hypothetical protein
VSSSPAEPLAALIWGVRESFSRYVEGVGGTIDALEPATRDAGAFRFPVAVGHRFSGSVRFRAHSGTLAVEVTDPEIVDDELVVGSGQHRVAIARLGPFVADGLGRARASAALTDDGAAFFGDVYDEGAELDPVVLIGAFSRPASPG